MPRPCVINADNLVTISKSRLESRIVALGTAKLEALETALRFALGLR
jgi:mRNA-degrading endonuclease toxin of MazEF toxin-antitoxin module